MDLGQLMIAIPLWVIALTYAVFFVGLFDKEKKR